MNKKTIKELNALNRNFYENYADEFNQKRKNPWEGWEKFYDLVNHRLKDEPRILDVGCGNGRFAKFLHQKQRVGFRYTGVDASKLALDHAKDQIGLLPSIDLVKHDFIDAATILPSQLPPEGFELIVVFGVLHHVPSQQKRFQLLNDLARYLVPGGLLAYTVWRFQYFERFMQKLIPIEDTSKYPFIKLNRSDLEPGDHFMTWGSSSAAYRYCHAISKEEATRIHCNLPLIPLANFLADGEKNAYYISFKDN